MVAVLRELAEHVSQVVDWSSEETNNGFEWRLAWGRWMGSRWDESLGTAKALRKLEALRFVNVLAQKWQVVRLLFFDVLGEVGP